MNAESPRKAGPGEQTGGGKSLNRKLSPPDDVPVHRPWAGRDDARAVERRFRLDKLCWRRRINCARRLSYDARDELVAPGGRWSG
jgi:hypothetical protein